MKSAMPGVAAPGRHRVDVGALRELLLRRQGELLDDWARAPALWRKKGRINPTPTRFLMVIERFPPCKICHRPGPVPLPRDPARRGSSDGDASRMARAC